MKETNTHLDRELSAYGLVIGQEQFSSAVQDRRHMPFVTRSPQDTIAPRWSAKLLVWPLLVHLVYRSTRVVGTIPVEGFARMVVRTKRSRQRSLHRIGTLQEESRHEYIVASARDNVALLMLMFVFARSPSTLSTTCPWLQASLTSHRGTIANTFSYHSPARSTL